MPYKRFAVLYLLEMLRHQDMHPISHILSTVLVGCAPVFCLGESILGFSLECFIYYSLVRIIEWVDIYRNIKELLAPLVKTVHFFMCK